MIERAAVKLGELNSFARLVPNIDLFIQLHVAKEAVVSSRIEGNLSYKAANDLVAQMVEHKIITEMTGQNRNRIFVFHTYLSIFES